MPKVQRLSRTEPRGKNWLNAGTTLRGVAPLSVRQLIAVNLLYLNPGVFERTGASCIRSSQAC